MARGPPHLAPSRRRLAGLAAPGAGPGELAPREVLHHDSRAQGQGGFSE